MPGRILRLALWAVVSVLVMMLLSFAVIRIGTDSGNFANADTLPDDDFNTRYAQHPVPAYLHIAPGVLYTMLAPWQFMRSLRRSRPGLHRAVGRVASGAGVVSAAFAVVFGVLYPWGGITQLTASVTFGLYFGGAIVLGVRRVRSRDIVGHRRWMIRAFAVALGVASIRVILILGDTFDAFTLDEAFGWAFWMGFAINAAIAELWLARRPRPVSGERGTVVPDRVPTT